MLCRKRQGREILQVLYIKQYCPKAGSCCGIIDDALGGQSGRGCLVSQSLPSIDDHQPYDHIRPCERLGFA
jgi:hypothetical protein